MRLTFQLKTGLITSLLFLFLLSPHTLAQSKSKQFVVVIDAGHGGKDIGARGATVKEKDVNLSVALMLGDLIKKQHSDVKVIFTRNTDVFIPLKERADIANKAKADLFIAIHANSVVKNKKPYGTETYTLGLSRTEENLDVAKRENSVILLEDDYKETYEGFDPKSSESYIIFEFMQNKYIDQSVSFASNIQKEFSTVAKRSDRGVKQAEFLVLRETSMPSVLIELGFLSNPEEEKYLGSKTGKTTLSDCIYNAFKQFKREHDRKQGIHSISSSDSVSERLSESVGASSARSSDKLIYKVQILAADRVLPTNSPTLKGYKRADYFYENGFYKYTYGESTDWSEISKIRKSLLSDFKDAFIVSFKNGKKVPTK